MSYSYGQVEQQARLYRAQLLEEAERYRQIRLARAVTRDEDNSRAQLSSSRLRGFNLAAIAEVARQERDSYLGAYLERLQRNVIAHVEARIR